VKDPEQRAEVLIEALPYIRRFHGEKVVIKLGGSIMSDPELKALIAADVVLLQYVGLKPLLVHGGGPEISSILERMGMDTRTVEGLRVTDEETMDVVEMVLAGRVNKDLVHQINQAGARAVGLSGKDGELLVAESHPSQEDLDVDLGQVGQITDVQPDLLEAMEEHGYVPVIAPIGVSREGRTFNVNADDAAGKIASALSVRKLIYMTDVPGVLRDGEPVPTLTEEEIQPLLEDDTVTGGMIPKLRAAREAVNGGVEKTHVIDGGTPHSLLLEILTQEGIGTQVIRERGGENDGRLV